MDVYLKWEQMTPILVCCVSYAVPIMHILPVTRVYEKNWHKVSPIKSFIIILSSQTGFSLLFIRFVFFFPCLLGWTVSKMGIVRDGTVTGTHLIRHWLVHNTQILTHMHVNTVAGSCNFHFLSALCSFNRGWNLKLSLQSSALTVNGS